MLKTITHWESIVRQHHIDDVNRRTRSLSDWFDEEVSELCDATDHFEMILEATDVIYVYYRIMLQNNSHPVNLASLYNFLCESAAFDTVQTAFINHHLTPLPLWILLEISIIKLDRPNQADSVDESTINWLLQTYYLELTSLAKSIAVSSTQDVSDKPL